MSEYMKQFKIQVASKIPGIKFQDKSGGELQLIKDGNVVAVIKDEKDYVTVTIKNNIFKYDKWYTKPEHLAETIRIYVERS
ncbi:MAG: hypothetical protein LM558_03990 [Thermosphaera sp.]|nr:hypothetical protein [Thermosphaera sp.]